MKARLAHLFRHFHWRILLKLALLLVTLIVLFYAEENWRGARTWTATKAKWEAQGETFDYAKLVPPPVPDSQNLAAIPLFHLELAPLSDEDKQAGLSAATNWKPVALEHVLESHPYPSAVHLQSDGQLPDPVLIRSDIATLYARVLGPPVNLSPLAQVDALYPYVADLNREAAMRSSCHFLFNKDNTLEELPARLALLQGQLFLAKVLRLHAVAALISNNADVALADLRTLSKLNEGISQDPSLLSGLILCAMMTFETSIIADGISLHAWNDAQLVQISQLLAPLDLLASYQHDLRGELAGFSLPAWYAEVAKIRQGLSGGGIDMGWLVPAGWFDFHAAATTDTFFEAIRLVDPAGHRVSSDRTKEAENRLENLPRRPWNMLLPMAAPVLFSLPEKFTRAQVTLDEARIAIALERYRLAHQAWPDTLDQLAAYGLPHPPVDPIDGQPYRYRVQFDGTFLLYSIGWNNTDDEGQIVTRIPTSDDGAEHDSHDRVENYGDWVWQPFAPEQ